MGLVSSTIVLSYRLNKEHEEKKNNMNIYMGNVVSKMKELLTRPIRYYERRKVQKIYDEIFQEDIWNSEIYPHEIEI